MLCIYVHENTLYTHLYSDVRVPVCVLFHFGGYISILYRFQVNYLPTFFTDASPGRTKCEMARYLGNDPEGYE